VETQEKMGYQSYAHLPFRTYSRKNMGYIYAIQHGAKIIYETDDDNIPDKKAGIIYVDEETKIMSYVPEEDQYVVNVYAHFGKPEVWPRGYPLRAINPGKYKEPAKSAESLKLIPIQQGLADRDPDVDAIFRLTQPLNIFFDKAPPISLPAGLMCPWNSQNTLFYETAFWGLTIPTTVSFRVCDIWRSYWVQRILWDIRAEVAFLPPTVDQIRNAHDYLLDFEEEMDLYFKAEPLAKFLNEWSSDKPTLPERILDVAIEMAERDFWGVNDAVLMKSWLEDLIAVGYEFPLPVS